jgi:nitrite reductase/ring-hydroxylating ferredoxin subunit
VYRNQIGVDHRYAGAGKWREAAIRDAEPVPDVEDLEPHQMMLLRAGARRLVLARTEEKFCAFDDRCTHKGGSLAGGILACGVVTCPWHGSQFDARTGAVKSGPAEEPIRTYPVEQSSSAVRVRL